MSSFGIFFAVGFPTFFAQYQVIPGMIDKTDKFIKSLIKGVFTLALLSNG